MRNRKRGAAGSNLADAHLINRFSETPGVWITMTGAAFYSHYYEKLKAIHLKPSLVTALAFIEQFEGITQSELGRKMKINRASAMAVANTLSDLGFIEKSQVAKLNQSSLALTELGASSLEHACKIEQEISAQVLCDLTEEEREVLVRTLKQVARRVVEAESLTKSA